jgi:hypothetical protein
LLRRGRRGQIASALNGPNAVPIPLAAKDLGIDLGVLAFCLFFLNRDNQAREKQVRSTFSSGLPYGLSVRVW